MLAILVLGKLRQQNHEFKASQDQLGLHDIHPCKYKREGREREIKRENMHALCCLVLSSRETF